jgi:phasin family protein
MMTNINNPFEFFDFQKMLSALKMPTVDGNSESLINAQKKTLETFANASKVLFEGYNALAKKQIEVLNKAISSAKDATSELAKGNPQQSAGKSIELIQESIVEAQNIATDFSKIAEKTAKESFEILNKRLLEGLTEIKKVIEEEGKKASVKN